MFCLVNSLLRASLTFGTNLLSFESIGEGLSLTARVITALLLVLLVVAMNLRGMDIVGGMSIVFFVMTLLPFVIFCILAVPYIDPSLWFQKGG